MNQLGFFIFHNDVIVTGTGNEYYVNQANVMNLQFNTSGTFSAKVEASLDGTTFKQVGTIVDLLNLTAMKTTSITDGTVLYQVDLTGFTKVRVNVTAITGNLSVVGKLVN